MKIEYTNRHGNQETIELKEETKEQLIVRLLKESNNLKHCNVSIIDAIEFRRDQYGLTQKEFANILGMQASHYNEFIKNKRNLTLKARIKAYAIGVPAEILLQHN